MFHFVKCSYSRLSFFDDMFCLSYKCLENKRGNNDFPCEIYHILKMLWPFIFTFPLCIILLWRESTVYFLVSRSVELPSLLGSSYIIMVQFIKDSWDVKDCLGNHWKSQCLFLTTQVLIVFFKKIIPVQESFIWTYM